MGLRVDRLTQLLLRLVQLVECDLHGSVVVAGERRLEGVDIRLHIGLDVVRQLVSVFPDELVGRVGELFGGVAHLGGFAAGLVFGRVLLGFAHHALDVFLGQRRAARDRHRLLLAGSLVFRRDVNNAVGVDVEGDLDLRNPTRCGCNALQLERAERLVVAGEVALALEHLDGDRRLVVVGGREGLAALGRNRGVAVDELRHHAALGLDAEAQRGDVDKQNIFTLALQHAGLQSSAHGDDLIRVDTLVRVFSA